MGYGELKISICTGKHIVLATVIRGERPADTMDTMRAAIGDLEGKHGESLRNWDGHMGNIRLVDEFLGKLLDGEYSFARRRAPPPPSLSPGLSPSLQVPSRRPSYGGRSEVARYRLPVRSPGLPLAIVSHRRSSPGYSSGFLRALEQRRPRGARPAVWETILLFASGGDLGAMGVLRPCPPPWGPPVPHRLRRIRTRGTMGFPRDDAEARGQMKRPCAPPVGVALFSCSRPATLAVPSNVTRSIRAHCHAPIAEELERGRASAILGSRKPLFTT